MLTFPSATHKCYLVFQICDETTCRLGKYNLGSQTTKQQAHIEFQLFSTFSYDLVWLKRPSLRIGQLFPIKNRKYFLIIVKVRFDFNLLRININRRQDTKFEMFSFVFIFVPNSLYPFCNYYYYHYY